MKNKKRYIFSLVSMLLVVVLITVSLMTFVKTVNKYEQESNNKRMSEMAKKNNEVVQSLLKGAYTTLDVVRTVLEETNESVSKNHLAILNKISKEGYFEYLMIQFPSGESYGGNGVHKYASYSDILNKIDNNIYISDFVMGEKSRQYEVDMAIPVKGKQGETKAILHGTLNIEKELNKLIKTKFDKDGYYHLIDSNGTYISLPEASKAFKLKESYFESIDELKYGSGSSAQKIKEDMKNGRSGNTHYSYEGDERYAYYEPIGINNWFISTVIPADIVNEQSKKIQYLGSELIIMLIVIVTIIYAVAIQLISRSTAIAQKQKEKLRLIEIEHERTLREISYSLFDNVLEADMTANTLLGDNIENLTDILKIEPNPTYNEFIEAIIQKLVREDFREEYRNKMTRESILNTFYSGKQVFTFECIERSDGINYEWIRITVRIYHCHNTDSIRIISYIKKIGEEKRRELQLRNKAERDSFTKLYNKITTEKKINQLIEERKEQNHVFVIIDIDNFKMVNDTLGHAFGDEILLKCTNNMKKIFGDNNIIGRIGGDEFVIFIPDYDSILDIEGNLELLRQKLCKEYKEGSVKISISIGAALYPQDGRTFEELYNKSDKALYYSKKKGRNRVTFYREKEEIYIK